MFTDIANWIYDKDYLENWFIAYGITSVVSFVTLIVSVGVKADGEIEYIYDIVFVFAIFGVVTLLYIIMRTVDRFIRWASEYITHGDVVLDNFISNMIVDEKKCHTVMYYLDVLYTVIGIVVALPLFLIGSMYVYPVSFIPIAFIGIVFAVMYMARVGWGVKKRLNTHVVDPDAHSKN